ncbi:HAD family hydrolase [Tessaracoccus sp. MC1865]|uniref:HAD family hydrolase n=1 Tax=Tessaracoccus sp. MC1865 TaxID=2760310 RepID=UPI001FD76AA6|nr:HAD family hydrolase [Tessaracoccus sp. MC1865]
MTETKMPERAQVLVDFKPTREFFVGIDSDGCAMDAMDIKHQECFTPAYIKYFNLQAASTLVRETALFVNLYSTTRGQNRWVALARLFELLRKRPEVLERGVRIPEGRELQKFLDSGYPRSDRGIADFAAAQPSVEIEECMEWGKGVNELIEWMVHGCAPFPGVREAFDAMAGQVDCMTVSATPMEALEREWHEHDLAGYMKVIAGQEMGSKAQHVHWAAKGKYEDDHIMLIGDAPGDRDSAFSEGVLFYPIMPGSEAASWQRFREEALPRFLGGTYRGEYQDALVAEYESLLPATPPWRTISPVPADPESNPGDIQLK